MPEPVLSRRTFLAAAGLGTAALVSGCDLTVGPPIRIAPTETPSPSPFFPGPFQTSTVILGEDAGTTALPQPLAPGQFPSGSDATYDVCQNGMPNGMILRAPLPTSVKAAVYYPSYPGTDHRVPTPNPLHLTKGPFPVLLYAHALRSAMLNATTFECQTPDPAQDFKSVEVMLRHVASYGCVCLAPDLSFAFSKAATEASLQVAFDQRAVVLVAYYAYLATLNDTLFAGQLDVSRVVVVGHSTGGGGAVHAGRLIGGFGHHLNALAHGLISPAFLATPPSAASISADVGNLLVLSGDRDPFAGVGFSAAAYAAGGTPKTLVTIPGGNHFGYTSLCPPDNTCGAFGLVDANGTISRASQQLTGAAYLAALVRFYALGDQTALPYLTGERTPEGLETVGVTGIQVQAQGFAPVHPGQLTPPPTAGSHP